ncbi:hypothetical protein ACHAPJ_011273 [Fusarium lateritium]
MASRIQDLVAVSTPEGNTILFQVDEDFNLCLYESSTPRETERKKYDNNSIRVNGGPVRVNEKLPVIAAVAYSAQQSCNNQAQVRLYYVSRDDLTLCELVRTGGSSGKWIPGEVFNDKGYSIAEGSGLTANIFQTGGNNFAVKIYYQQNNKDKYPDVVYNVAGSDDWSTRPNVTKA